MPSFHVILTASVGHLRVSQGHCALLALAAGQWLMGDLLLVFDRGPVPRFGRQNPLFMADQYLA